MQESHPRGGERRFFGARGVALDKTRPVLQLVVADEAEVRRWNWW